MALSLNRLPSRYMTSWRLKGLLPLLLISAFAALFIPSLHFSSQISAASAGDGGYYRTITRFSDGLDSGKYIVVSLPRQNLYDKAVLDEVAAFTDELQSIEGVSTVVSLSSFADISAEGSEITTTAVYDRNAEYPANADSLKTYLERNTLLKSFILSDRGTAWSLVVVTETGKDVPAIVERIRRIAARHEGAQAYGFPIVEYFIGKTMKSDFIRLLGPALLIVFLIMLYITRRGATAAVLWLFSVIPMFWSLALFPVFGLELKTSTILMPLEILVLSTSYGIHIFRFHEAGDGTLADTLDSVSPIVFMAGSTTMIGFSSLLFSYFPETRLLGGVLIIGIALSIVSALFFLPLILERMLPPGSGRKERTYPLKISTWSVVVVIGLCLVSAPGIFRLYTDFRFESNFRTNSEISNIISYFNNEYGGMEELDILVDSGSEYGLVDTQLYGEFSRAADKLRSIPGVRQVTLFTDFVTWFNGRYEGANGGVPPETDEEIGEALELLSSNLRGFSFYSLIDPSYSRARIKIRFESTTDSGSVTKNFSRLKSEAARAMADIQGKMRWTFAGSSYESEFALSRTTWAMIRGTLLFFPLLLLFLFFMYRSLRWSLLCLIPPAAGVLFYWGLSGWTGIPASPATSIAIAAILGVSVDDSLFFTRYYLSRKSNTVESLHDVMRQAGTTNIQTTLIICFGFSPMIFSDFKTIAQAGFLCVAALSLSTSVTLTLVPVLIRRFIAKRNMPNLISAEAERR